MEVVRLWEKAKALEALEARIKELCHEVDITEEMSPTERVEVLQHLVRCEKARNEELVRKYETSIPLPIETLAVIAFDEFNNCIDEKWSETLSEQRKSEWVSEAVAIAQAIRVSLKKVPHERLNQLFHQSRGDLRSFVVSVFHEAIALSP